LTGLPAADTAAAGTLRLDPAEMAATDRRFTELLTAVEETGLPPGEQVDLRAAREAFREFTVLGEQVVPGSGDGAQNTPDPDGSDREQVLAIALGSSEGRLGAPYARADEALLSVASSAQARFETAMDRAASGRWLGLAIPLTAGGVLALLALGVLPRLNEYRL